MAPRVIGGHLSDGPLVGREKELTRLQAALDVAASAQGRVVVLAGEPGIGKSRLAHELLARAERRGWRRLIGRSFEEYATVPFFSMSEVLADALQAASPMLRAQAAERWPEVAALLPERAETSADSGQPRSTDGGQLRVFRAVTAFLRTLSAEQPTVLLLEDLHWTDSASLGLLLYLGRHLQGGRMLVVATYRDVELTPGHPLEDTLHELLREQLADEMTLRELDASESASLIRACAGTDDIPDDLVEHIHRRTDGNPFFIQEVLKSLVEQGGVARWHRGTSAELEVPRSVRLVVGQRVRRLPPEVQETLRIASVLGQAFALDVLGRVADQSEATILDHLDAAFRARLIVEDGADLAHERYAFGHAIIQQTLYSDVPAHRLRRLHRRVGDALEALHGTRPESAAELAHHFGRAGDAARALAYSRAAGDHAVDQFAHAEAAQHYATAADLAVESGDELLAAGLREKLALELTEVSRAPQALRALDEALDEYRRAADTAGQARVHYLRSRVYQYRFDNRSAEAPIDAALRLWPAEAQESRDFATVLFDAARLKTFSGDHAGARPLAERGCALAERLGDAGLQARALIELECIGVGEGAPDSDLFALQDRAEGLARTARNWRLVGRLHLNRGGLKESRGDLLGSREERQLALAAWERGGFVWAMAWGGFVLALVCLALGEWSAARSALRTTREHQPHFPGLDALSAWLDGGHRRALVLLPEFVDDARRRNDVQNVHAALMIQADFALQLGELGVAEGAVREAVALPTVERTIEQNARVGLAEILAIRAAADAEAALDDAEQYADQPRMQIDIPQLLRARGLWLLGRGDLVGARNRLSASADIARTQSARVQLGRTLAVLVDVARRQGDLAEVETIDTERARLAERIGPAVHGLSWSPRSQHLKPADEGDGQADSLTPREREVAELVAGGLTNGQIARRLVITERTVAAHIEHINAKLGFSSRTQIGVWASHRQYRQ